jgi:hypothetical protein
MLAQISEFTGQCTGSMEKASTFPELPPQQATRVSGLDGRKKKKAPLWAPNCGF